MENQLPVVSGGFLTFAKRLQKQKPRPEGEAEAASHSRGR
jgi:hypothetical protein